MAKKEMKCPFLGELCKNCAIYIGRHYYLCYCENYRGYIGRRRGAKKPKTHPPFSEKTKKDFRIPKIKIEAFDPFNTDL